MVAMELTRLVTGLVVAPALWAAAGAGVGALKTNMLLPLYVYPSPGAWNEVYEAIEKNPRLEFQIVLNPDTGPGSNASIGYDSNWINATATLNSYPNARVFGYVHLLDGNETTDAVVANISTWRAWGDYAQAAASTTVAAAGSSYNASNNISVQGIFFDETPANNTAYMQVLADAARDALGAGAQLIFNPGRAVPDPRYFSLADHVIVSEVPAARYNPAVPGANVEAQYAARASVLVYDFAGGDNASSTSTYAFDPAAAAPGNSSQLKTWLDGMVQAGIGSVNVINYGWDAANASGGVAGIDVVARLLVEAKAAPSSCAAMGWALRWVVMGATLAWTIF